MLRSSSLSVATLISSASSIASKAADVPTEGPLGGHDSEVRSLDKLEQKSIKYYKKNVNPFWEP